MNLSHIIHELSFGPYFPEIAQPLDSSMEITQDSEHCCRDEGSSHLTSLG